MPPCLSRRSRLLALALSLTVSVGCGTQRAQSRGAPRQYAQATDSATNTALRNPAYYIAPPGEDAVLPWLARSVEAARTAATALRLLDAAELARVEQILKDCANQASFEVNERLLGKGQRPTRQLCKQVYKTDQRGKKVTWAAHLGREKHQAALECMQKELGELADYVSLQPQYSYNVKTKKIQLLDPRKVEEWLREGLLHKLLGTLIPDVVLHAAGNALQIQGIYDFKFPCPSENPPEWYPYEPPHPYAERSQGDMYKEAFRIEEPARVAPGYGIIK
ncbi:MAG: hypothetical protein JXB05_34185 [Myxococcaceae bacterium]|nr:hypothetical protein [Myxococcaceae bacterium]